MQGLESGVGSESGVRWKAVQGLRAVQWLVGQERYTSPGYCSASDFLRASLNQAW